MKGLLDSAPGFSHLGGWQIVAYFGLDASQVLLSWIRRLLCERGSRKVCFEVGLGILLGSVTWVEVVPQHLKLRREIGEGCHMFLVRLLIFLETGSISPPSHGQVG